MWAGKLIVAQSDYESLIAKSEYLLPWNTTRWWTYFSLKVRNPWARLSASINPCTVTQWREWSYTNLHWHSIWLLGAWRAEVLSSVPPFTCMQLAGYLLYPSYHYLWPDTVVVAQPASCTSVCLQIILGWFLPSQFLNDSSLWVSNISCGRLFYTSQFRNKTWEPNQILILFLPAIFPWISLNKLPRWCVCLANTYWELSYLFYYPCLTWAHSLFPFCSPLSCYLHYLIVLKIVFRLI